MTSVSHVAAGTAAAATTSTPAPVAAPKPKAAPAPSAGPAATLQLSQAALAKLAGDKDWQPGMKIDNG
jgi:hypothetical protein